MSIELMMPSNHLVLCYPLLFLPFIFPSYRVFSNELTLCLRWPKDWSFSISHSNEDSALFHPPDMWDPSSPNPCPLQWKCWVINTEPPGKSLILLTLSLNHFDYYIESKMYLLLTLSLNHYGGWERFSKYFSIFFWVSSASKWLLSFSLDFGFICFLFFLFATKGNTYCGSCQIFDLRNS